VDRKLADTAITAASTADFMRRSSSSSRSSSSHLCIQPVKLS
jgi:hypothetical protein